MAHFAKVEDGVVVNVIVTEQDFIDTLPDKEKYIQTSYNTHKGVHALGGTPLRKNFAGIGFTYNVELDAFIPPQPYPSWVLNEEIGDWESPIPYPNDEMEYYWDETEGEWVAVNTD